MSIRPSTTYFYQHHHHILSNKDIFFNLFLDTVLLNCLFCSNRKKTYMGPKKFNGMEKKYPSSDGNDHFFHEPRSFTIMSPNVIKIWATIIHFELSKIWSSITHEWSAIIYNHNYFIFSVNFSWFSPINFEIKSENIFCR